MLLVAKLALDDWGVGGEVLRCCLLVRSVGKDGFCRSAELLPPHLRV